MRTKKTWLAVCGLVTTVASAAPAVRHGAVERGGTAAAPAGEMAFDRIEWEVAVAPPRGLPARSPEAVWSASSQTLNERTWATSRVSRARDAAPVVLEQTDRDAPPNDDCANAYEFDLLPGTPVVISGDNTGATQDCPELGTEFSEVWFKFTTYELLGEVAIRLCGTTPAFENGYTMLVTDCPCSSGTFINASRAEGLSCGDGNATLSWRSLPAGTYYYPLLTDSTQGYAEGPYTLTFEARGVIPSEECPAEALYGHTNGQGAYGSGDAGGTPIVVYDNFSGLTEKIGGVEWWGLRFGFDPWYGLSTCESEVPFEFEIKLYLDDAGAPGAEVGSYTVAPTVTPVAPASYLGYMYHFSTAELIPCYMLESGWISIASLPHPDGCIFLWMSSEDGDLTSYQDIGGTMEVNATDLAFCLMPGDCPDIYGACCNDYTGTCDQTLLTECLPPARFTADTECGVLDPPCGVVGACCSAELACVGTGFEADCDALNGFFFPGESCDDPEFVCPATCDHRIDLYARDPMGWRGNTLDVLVNGEIVLSQITLESGEGPLSFTFPAETGDTIETVYHVVEPWPEAQYYEIYDGRGYWLGFDGVDEEGEPGEPVTGITVIGNCEVVTTGACCHYEGGCDLIASEECIDGEFLGLGAPCWRCPECFALCPPDGVPETEVCGEDTNGGCDNPGDPAFETITCGDTVCGTAWADYPNDWDTDWYELAPAAEYRLITLTLFTLERTSFGVMRAGPGGGCIGTEMVEDDRSIGCYEASITFEALPGETYWFYTGRISATSPCDLEYTATLTCEVLPSGACCLPSGECIETTVSGCEAEFGSYQGDDTVCGDVTCTPSYCAAGSLNCSEGHVAQVLVGTIDNTSTCGSDGYEDYTSLSTDLSIGSMHLMYVDNGIAWDSRCAVWIDYNQDLDFDDPGEHMPATYADGLYRIRLTPPVDALLGATRMRVSVGRDGEDAIPCGVSPFAGEVEDYSVNLTDGPGACCTPAGECLTLNGAVECIVDYEGAWFAGETCIENEGDFVCPAGACCTPEYECVTADRDTCEQNYDGSWYIGETCVQDGGIFECELPDFGSCCSLYVTGGCDVYPADSGEMACNAALGDWYLGERCANEGGDFVCPAPAGACCDAVDDCHMVASESVCVGIHAGEWYPDEVCVADGGDFECLPPGPGACCDDSDDCYTLDGPHECLTEYYGATWYSGETCVEDGGSFECPFSGGACCMFGGTWCTTAPDEFVCVQMLGGEYYPGEQCVEEGGDFVCPTGSACCTPEGPCVTTETETECTILHSGTWYEGEDCATFTCPGSSAGACCTMMGDCVLAADEMECNLMHMGTWYEGEDCATFTCPGSGGACCTPGGMCINTSSEMDCVMLFSGTYYPGEDCATFPCPGSGGACCTPDGMCINTSSEMDCVMLFSGTYYAGEDCDGGFVCPGQAGWCDLDGDDDVDYDDYVIFLDAFGGPVDGNPPQDAACDYDGSGAVGMADYAAWLQCYRDFVGNPLAGPPTGPDRPDADLGAELSPRPSAAGSATPDKAQPRPSTELGGGAGEPFRQ